MLQSLKPEVIMASASRLLSYKQKHLLLRLPEQVTLPRLQVSPVKFSLGCAAIIALTLTLAIQRIPAPKDPIVVTAVKQEQPPFNPEWASSFERAVLKKADKVRVIDMAKADEPKPIQTERVVPLSVDSAPVVPSVAPAREDNGDTLPAARHGRHAEYTSDNPGVCARHGMHKQVTRGGKSWRCAR